SQLSDRITRVLGQNPGKFTLQGTNTYLLGLAPPYVLFDTGEGREAYIPLLEETLQDMYYSHSLSPAGFGQVVSDIVLSHKHKDHHAGLPGVLSILSRLAPAQPLPRVWKYPLPAGETDSTLHAPGTTLRVLHTPGHSADSVCVHLLEEDALLTADTVLGQGTTVFDDLAAYISSLRRLLEECATAERVYPGHGPVVERGREHVRQYIAHRLEREAQIVAVLRSGGSTAGGVVRVLYKAYPESLWQAAERGVLLHLSKLEGEGRVRRVPAVGGEEEWELIDSEGQEGV
ncbi:Metallo-hydrolase/oxidoreductase, partial [Calocera viscosa TUFC12733]